MIGAFLISISGIAIRLVGRLINPLTSNILLISLIYYLSLIFENLKFKLIKTLIIFLLKKKKKLYILHFKIILKISIIIINIIINLKYIYLIINF